jgi:hypothetical protein
VIGLLRLVGLLNAAVWFGAAVFFLFGAEPALTGSRDIQQLLEPRNYPYFSVALAQLVGVRFFRLYLLCGFIALLHLTGEWLYLGKYPRRLWLALLLMLWLGGCLEAFWLQPRLQTLHQREFTASTQRVAARDSLRFWQGASHTLEAVLVCGLGIYLWRMANPPDPMRFVSATKFRS